MSDPAVNYTVAQRELLLTIYRIFEQHCDWPALDTVDYHADRQGLGDAWSLLHNLPPGLVNGVSTHAASTDTQTVSLTMAGMAAAADHDDVAASDFQVFCESVMLAVEIADCTAPPEAPILHSNDIVQRVDLPATGRPGVLARLYKQWSVNGHLWIGMGGGGDSWVLTLNRRGLRRYRGASSKVSFLAAEAERTRKVAHYPPGTPGPVGTALDAPTARAEPGELPEWFALLPADLATAIESRFATGHPEDAFVHGWKTLASTLSDASGLPLDGYDLVNQSARHLNDPATETEANLTRGYTDLLRGLARIRNVHAHRGAAALTNLEVAAFTLLLGACGEWIQSREDFAAPPAPHEGNPR